MRAGMIAAGDSPVLAVQRDGRWHQWKPPRSGTAWSAVDVLEAGEQATAGPALDVTRLLPPIIPPRNVICLGKNYHAHAEEFATYSGETEDVPEAPIVFTKPVGSLCGAGDVINVDRQAAWPWTMKRSLALSSARQARGSRLRMPGIILRDTRSSMT